MSELDKARARIEELERACGAAAIALALDALHLGIPLRELRKNSPSRMALEAVGVNLEDPNDLVRFRNAYMARFSPEGSAHG